MDAHSTYPDDAERSAGSEGQEPEDHATHQQEMAASDVDRHQDEDDGDDVLEELVDTEADRSTPTGRARPGFPL
jgi:hypothetical protein